MEQMLTQFAINGGPVGVLAAALVYLIIFIQRKHTSEIRNDDNAKLKDQIIQLKGEIAEMETEKQLIQKDVDHLKEENIGIKDDIKEIKATLQTMALALERIAAKYEK